MTTPTKKSAASRASGLARVTSATTRARQKVASKVATPVSEPVATPRERMVRAAATLLSERGLDGTSFSEVIERSGAPRGSIYHHFPEGKDALTAEAIALVGGGVLALLRPRDGESPRQVVERLVLAWRRVLTGSQFNAGCAIAAVANARVEHPDLGARAAEFLSAWERQLEDTLHASGLAPARAALAASLIIASLEGVLIVCRARQRIEPLDAVGAALVAFVEG